MSMSALAEAIRTAQDRLDTTYEYAQQCRRSGAPETLTALDTFLAETFRHANAILDVVIPHIGKRGGLKHGYIDEMRMFESKVTRAKKHPAHDPDTDVWDDLTHGHDTLRSLEGHMIERVDALVSDEQMETMARRFREALDTAPTRPHPHLPHTGPFGHVARSWAARSDHRVSRA